jgi:uncharacterized membrane protein YfcA
MIVALGILVGLVLGLTGAGGSVLAVPLLMAGMGWTLPQAAPVALLAVCAAATFGTIVAWDRTHVRFRAAALMGLLAVVTAPIGVRLASIVPLPLLTLLFSVVLALVGTRLFVQAARTPAEAGIVRATVAGEGPTTGGHWIPVNAHGRIVWGPRTAATVSGIGALTGFLAGLLGVGGGFVIVPALRMASGLSMHSAVATSLMAIALISAIAAAGALAQGVHVEWAAAPGFVLGALAGMFAGRRLAPRIAGPRLQQGFAVVMLAIAMILGGHTALLMAAAA